MSRSCRIYRGRIATGRPSRTSKTPALRPPPCGWGIYLAQGVRFLSGDEISSSAINISPALFFSSPATILNEVVFPHPDGPKKDTNSPSFILKERLLII